MADEYNRAILLLNDATRCRDILGQSGKRLLNDTDAISVLGEYVINAAPPRAIGDCAVHQYHVAHWSDLCRLGTGA